MMFIIQMLKDMETETSEMISSKTLFTGITFLILKLMLDYIIREESQKIGHLADGLLLMIVSHSFTDSQESIAITKYATQQMHSDMDKLVVSLEL